MNTWRVLKKSFVEVPENAGFTEAFVEVDSAFEAKYQYGGPEAQELGEAYGEGEFLLLSLKGSGISEYAIKTISAGTPVFVEVDALEPVPA